MGHKDWYYVHLPKLLIKRLDQFLQTPRAKSMGMTNKPELLRYVVNKFLDDQEVFYNKIDYLPTLQGEWNLDPSKGYQFKTFLDIHV